MVDLRPCVLERKILPKVWGGRALSSVLGLDLPGEEAIGETWELYDRKDGSSQIRGSDETLRDWMVADATGVLGRGVQAARDGYFPLLIKYIDAADKLSVQVHPDDARAAAEGDMGKSEAWVVLGKGPNARIVCGFAPGVSEEEFRQVAHTDAVEGLLHAFEPEVGQGIYVPAGTVHAIGPDVVVYEVQQNSDITYRLYDWGRPRETHVEKALEVTRIDDGLAPTGAAEIDAQSAWLFRNAFFTTRRSCIESPATLGTEGTFKILSVIEGRGTLGWQSASLAPPIVLNQGDTVLVPACVDVTFLSPIGKMELLVSGPGGSK